MASPTKKTEIIRKRKKSRAGHKRKAQVCNQGTTKTAAQLFGDDE